MHAIDSLLETYHSFTDEELSIDLQALTEQHEKYEAECLARMAYERTAPTDMIRMGARLGMLVAFHAPLTVINYAACKLAEQTVLYYYAAKGTKTYSVWERIANGDRV